MESIGQLLKDLRKEHGMTQKALSENICSQSVLSRIENDEEIPNILVVQRLCQRLGITVDQLMMEIFPEESLVRKYFSRMYAYLRKEQYLEILAVLEHLEEKGLLHLDKDRQQFYFFQALCDYHLKDAPLAALEKINKGLKISLSTKSASDLSCKVLLLSLAGKMNEVLGNSQPAYSFYHQALELFVPTMTDSSDRLEVTLFFADYAAFLIKEAQYEKARKVVNLGLKWSYQQQSYYKLDELLQLKIKLLELFGETKQQRFHSDLLETVKQLKENR